MVILKTLEQKIRQMDLAFVSTILVILLSAFILGFFIKGDRGKPINYQTESEQTTTVESPFESSNSTARYALTEALVEHGTTTLTEREARFASPDVSRYNGKFLSIFMPGISFIGVPFYIIGKFFGLPQLFTYFSVTLFGLINMLLIARIAYKLGANLYAGLLAGFLFLFATNALPYSLFYTQHITTVTFLLLSILAALGRTSLLNTVLFGIFAGASFTLDLPNIVFLFPVGIFLLHRYISAQKENDGLKVAFNIKFFTFFLGFIPFIVFLSWYNFQTTGTYTKLGQTIGRTTYFNPPTTKKGPAPTKQFSLPIVPRQQMTGMYTLMISNERSWLYYSPIVLVGILGFIALYKKKEKQAIANMLAGVVLLNIIFYSMFGDPWGGWAFGPRYLIPGAAVMSIGLALAIQKYKNRIWFVVVFAAAAFYSLIINILGALTTSAIPPKVEATHLDKFIPYTYQYNVQLANDNRISALIYNVFFFHISAWVYIFCLFGVLAVVTIVLYQLAIATRKNTV